MTESTSPPPSRAPGQADVPSDLVTAVVELVGTGAVMLGAYTLAELTAVDAVVDFLESRPSDEALAEAVRSLAARELLVPGDDAGTVKVRGDLGIAVAFQQRARSVLDARGTGTAPGQPWRTLLLPQPEGIALVIQIDALGVHAIGLYPIDDALDRLTEWLPSGDIGDADSGADVPALLAAASRTALLTLTRYSSLGSAEKADSSVDVTLVSRDNDLLVFRRDAADSGQLKPQKPQRVRELVTSLLSEPPR